jgi:hypothetical protein
MLSQLTWSLTHSARTPDNEAMIRSLLTTVLLIGVLVIISGFLGSLTLYFELISAVRALILSFYYVYCIVPRVFHLYAVSDTCMPLLEYACFWIFFAVSVFIIIIIIIIIRNLFVLYLIYFYLFMYLFIFVSSGICMGFLTVVFGF